MHFLRVYFPIKKMLWYRNFACESQEMSTKLSFAYDCFYLNCY